MTKTTAVDRRALSAIAVAIAALMLLMVAIFAGSSSAHASTAYPPSGPTATVTCAVSSSVSSTDCGKDAVHVNKTTKHTSQSKDSGALASTGFATASALVIVVALLGVGGFCLYAGKRRHA